MCFGNWVRVGRFVESQKPSCFLLVKFSQINIDQSTSEINYFDTGCGCQTLQWDNVVRDHTSRLFLMQLCLYSRGRKLPAAGHFWPTKSPELGPKLNVINDSILLLGIFFLNLFSIVFFVLCSLYLFLGTAKKKNPKFLFYCRTRVSNIRPVGREFNTAQLINVESEKMHFMLVMFSLDIIFIFKFICTYLNENKRLA